MRHPWHYAARLANSPAWRSHYNSYQAARTDADRTIRQIRPLFRETFTRRYEPAPEAAPTPAPAPRTRNRWRAVTGRP